MTTRKPFTLPWLKAEIRLGEDSTRQFKRDIHNSDSLAAEIVAFANADGGTILIGVTDDGTLSGLATVDLQRINQLIANVASQAVRSPVTVQTRNIPLPGGRIVVAVTVPKGLDKPYFDRNGVIWLKAGSDKRRLNSREELRRLFQMTDQFHADGLPTEAGPEALDLPRLREFLRDNYGTGLPANRTARLQLLKNLNLTTADGLLNLAGLLLFAQEPQRWKPQFVLKAVSYPGNTIHTSRYEDTEDFSGPLRQIFDGAMAFINRNLHKVQAGRGVNSQGVPEIPLVVFEELLVNALVHRDYLVSAPVRLFIFSDRIEIISPGHLPNNLTVDNIRNGNSNIRNPILASYVAKGLLPYRGLGSGVPRAIEAWPRIEFQDDRDGMLFIAKVTRTAALPGSEKSSEKSSEIEWDGTAKRILEIVAADPATSAREVAATLGLTSRAVEKQFAALKATGRLRRVGPAKGGRWEVAE
jgi:ATP-dependent DNA helicase RecG